MSEEKWELLVCLSDVPSAGILLEILGAEGITARLITDAAVMGQAAPCRIFIAASQLHRARWILAQRELTEEELTLLATG